MSILDSSKDVAGIKTEKKAVASSLKKIPAESVRSVPPAPAVKEKHRDTSFQTVDAVVMRFIKKIPREVWIAIFAAFLCGLLVHMQALSGFILNWDSVSDSFHPEGKSRMITQGKWFFQFIANVHDRENIGSCSSLLAILFISVSAGFTTAVLDIRRPLFAVLTGMVMVSFPSVMCTFSYAGEEIFYFMLALSTAAVYVTVKCKHGMLIGTGILTLAVGGYAAYIGIAASIFLFLCILELLRGDKPISKTVKTGISYIIVLLISIVLYYVILRILLIATGSTLSSYRGIDAALTSVSIRDLPKLIFDTYKKVLKFFWKDAYGRSFPRDVWAYRLTVFAVVAMLIAYAKVHQTHRQIGRLALAGVLGLLMPLAVHAIGILGQNANTHWIMIYPFSMIFVFTVKLAGEFEGQHERKATGQSAPASRGGALLQWVSAAVLVLVLANWFVTANAGYTRLKLSFEGAYAQNTIIANELIRLPEYEPKKPLAVIGADQTYTGDRLSYMGRFTGMSRGRDFMLDNTDNLRRANFIRDYIGLEFTPVPIAKNKELAATEVFKNMPCYPQPGFAKEIDGILVVKLSDL